MAFEDQNSRLTYLNKMNTDGGYIKFINRVDEGLIIVAGNKLIIFEYDKNEFSVQERKEISVSWTDLVNYMTEIDRDWLLSEIVSNSGIVRLGINEQGEMYSDGYVFDFGSPSEVYESRKIIDLLLK